METINNALRWWARTAPEFPALCVGADRLSYFALHDWSHRIAAHLVALGVRHGDRVAVCAPNSLDYCALCFGVMQLGGIVVPLSVRYTAHELRTAVDDFTPRIAFAGREQEEKFAGLGVHLHRIDDIAGLREGKAIEVASDIGPDDPIVIISTSGSTAKPKGVVHTHRTMIAYAYGWAIDEPGFGRGARIISAAPMNTSAGFFKVVQMVAVGATLFFESVFDPERYLEILTREKITTFGGVPVFFERIAASPSFETADLSSLKTCLCGGARVPRAMQDKWMAKGVVIRQLYGQTEVGGFCTLMPADLAAAFPEKCGRGGVFTELATVDEKGNRCKHGEPGQILTRGPNNMVGYWGNPEATADALREGWLYTGDIGVLDENGYLTFVDRMKDIIISGGLNISSAEVERVIGDYQGVEEVAVIGVADDRFGETPMAVIYATEQLSIDGLIAHCNSVLSDFKVPRYVVMESEPLPRLTTGKLAKVPLREKYRAAQKSLQRVR